MTNKNHKRVVFEYNSDILAGLVELTKDGTPDDHERRAKFMYKQMNDEAERNGFKLQPSVYGLLNDWATKGWTGGGYENEYDGELSGDRALELYEKLCNLKQKNGLGSNFAHY